MFTKVLVFPAKGYVLGDYEKYFPNWVFLQDQENADLVLCHGSGISNTKNLGQIPIIALNPSVIPVENDNVYVWARKGRVDVPIGVSNLFFYTENTRDPHTVEHVLAEIMKKAEELVSRKRKFETMKSLVEKGFQENKEHPHFTVDIFDTSLVGKLSESFPFLKITLSRCGTFAWVETHAPCEKCRQEREKFLCLVASKARPLKIVFNCDRDFTINHGESFLPFHKILSKNSRQDLEILVEASGMTKEAGIFSKEELIFLVERSGIVPGMSQT